MPAERPQADAGRFEQSVRTLDAAHEFEPWQIELHGHRVMFHRTGSGPAVVLIHGMVNSSRHWREVALRLASKHTVIAPDLIGHGDSATPRGDYSLGAHASSIRDMLAVIGIERATIVGHSLGGGVAMQFFYQFPQRTERLVLMSSGGLGRDVSPLLRVSAIPGASALIRLAAHPGVLAAVWSAGAALERAGAGGGVHLKAIARALRPLERAAGRNAFLHTLRAVIDARGQRVSATDRLYLLRDMPTLILWGGRDRTIPARHGHEALERIPGGRMEILPKAAHFPHLEDPSGVAREIARFIADTEPAQLADVDWGPLLSPNSPHDRVSAPV